MLIDIGIFAHNESATIEKMIAEIRQQNLSGYDIRVFILANGCTDDTVAKAKKASPGDPFEIVDLSEGGKSRTWNRFVHQISRKEADILVFSDADIVIPPKDGIAQLALTLNRRPDLFAVNSHPIKDIVYQPENLSPLDRVIAMSSETLNDWKTAICGSLYAMPASKARLFHLPIGLAVEDGFLRAVILTGAFEHDELLKRIDGEDVFHIFKSERSIASLVRHQTRIVVGSAVNMTAFQHLHMLKPGTRLEELKKAANNDNWLPSVIRSQLPKWPFGWIPFHYLTKRVQYLMQQPTSNIRPRHLLVMVVGFGFDLVVYLIAQFRMARGTGAGFW